MEENSYRQSRLCRLLGNPVALAVVELLAKNQELNPNEIARAVGRSVQRVSNVLGYGHIYQSGSKVFPSSKIKPRSM